MFKTGFLFIFFFVNLSKFDFITYPINKTISFNDSIRLLKRIFFKFMAIRFKQYYVLYMLISRHIKVFVVFIKFANIHDIFFSLKTNEFIIHHLFFYS